MKKAILLLLIIPILLSSCATIFNGQYQRVQINHHDETQVYVDGKKPELTKKGKYKIRRDKKPKEITFKQEGYKDYQIVEFPICKSKLTSLSEFPGALLILIPIFLDTRKNVYNYGWVLSGANSLKLPEKNEGPKNFTLKNVELHSDSISFNYTFYNHHSKKKLKKLQENLIFHQDIENNTFRNPLNQTLTNLNFTDTSKQNNFFTENLHLNASINRINISIYDNIIAEKYYAGSCHLSVEWSIVDEYGNILFTRQIKALSSDFAFHKKNPDIFIKAINDALEFSIIAFLNQDKAQEIINAPSEKEIESKYDTLRLKKPAHFIQNVNDAIKNTVTIRTDNGHGSAFPISEDGYFLTNYHVIINSKELKVILNDKSEHSAKVIRVSKISDLALLKVDSIHCLPFQIYNEKKEIEIASDIYAVGTPNSEDFSQSITKGIVSGIREEERGTFIQIDASINTGNSGGPLINKNGTVMGVVSTKLNGYGIEGVAFCVPSQKIFDHLKIKLVNNVDVSKRKIITQE